MHSFIWALCEMNICLYNTFIFQQFYPLCNLHGRHIYIQPLCALSTHSQGDANINSFMQCNACSLAVCCIYMYWLPCLTSSSHLGESHIYFYHCGINACYFCANCSPCNSKQNQVNIYFHHWPSCSLWLQLLIHTLYTLGVLKRFPVHRWKKLDKAI